jgi:hypothetical protein
MARVLARSGARVYYNLPEDRRDTLNDAIIGDGMEDVRCVNSLWDVKNITDCFVFPDIRRQEEQKELRDQGLAVWGSQKGMSLEQDRLFFLEKLEELGLDVPPYEVVKGVSNLGAFLKSKKDIWIKVSKWRGTWETFHWRSWGQDWNNIDIWAVKFGGLKEHITFICFPKIETDLEIGADTYNIGGQWPSQMLHGIERKDAAYFSSVTTKEDMPEQLIPIMDAFSPFLHEVGYRSQWSMEVRVTDEKNFFIDATTRGGLPSSATFLSAKNVAEVIFEGAHGNFVEIDYGFLFSAECMVKIHGLPRTWETVELEPEVKEAMLLQNFCEVDGNIWLPADDDEAITDIGWLCVTGNTPTEVAERMNELADMLPDGADAQVEALSDVIKEVEEEKSQGIFFTDIPMPDPEVVLEP